MSAIQTINLADTIEPTIRKGMYVGFKKLHPAAILPAYASAGAACFDLHALIPEAIDTDGNVHTEVIRPVYAGGATAFKTGLAVEIPPGFGMLIFSRSGHGFNKRVMLTNSVGVIDSDYRGEIGVSLTNEGHTQFDVRHGDRIAQALILPLPLITFYEIHTELSDTARGTGGFGSTGQALIPG